MGMDLQVRLTGLSAPGQLVDLARPYQDLQAYWKACPSPEPLLWLAARLAHGGAERRAVVACLAELIRRAERASGPVPPGVARAAVTAETWARTGATVEELLMAELIAREAAAAAAATAAEEHARARLLFRSAPRRRPASYTTSQALGALAGWQQADRARRVALAAAGAARAAAEAARADEDGAALAAGGPGGWEDSVRESAGYAVSALGPGRAARSDVRAARRAARLVRRRLPCPHFD